MAHRRLLCRERPLPLHSQASLLPLWNSFVASGRKAYRASFAELGPRLLSGLARL